MSAAAADGARFGLWQGDGLRVVELGEGISAPYGARLLADFGADVIKVEPPGCGDPARAFGPFPDDLPHPEKSGLFLYLNAGKRGVTLDPGAATGRLLLKKLLQHADLLIENLAPGRSLPIDEFESLNPRLVTASISGFGRDGPYGGWRAMDLTAYAMGGMMEITGEAGREPLKHGLAQAQHLAGVQAAAASLAAVRLAKSTGRGQRLDISLQEVVAGTIFPALNLYAYTGAVMQRAPAGGGRLVSSSPMPARDGYVMPSYAGFGDWQAFAAFMGLPELAEERFATPAGRVAAATEIDDIVGPAFAARSKHELFHEGQAWGFTFSAVQTPGEISRCPQLSARGFFVEVEHPVAGRVRLPGMVPQAGGLSRAPARPAPLLGQHNVEVYCDGLGLTRAQLVRLRAHGTL